MSELSGAPEDTTGLATGEIISETSAPHAVAIAESFLAAVAAGDADGVVATMSSTAEMITPLSNRAVIRGHNDLRIVFSALLPSLSKELRWTRFIPGPSGASVAIAQARLAGVPVQDAMVIEQSADGAIVRVTPHVRPLLGLLASSLILGPKLIRHPGVMLRALRAN